MASPIPEQARIVADTLMFIGSNLWLGCEEDREWARRTADEIGRYDFDEVGWCCPICQEVVCDGGCPLYWLRVRGWR